MKYIMTQAGPILFSVSISHKTISKGHGTVFSAGFVKITSYNSIGGAKVECYGGSDSLGKKSKGGDAALIEAILNV